MGNDFLTIYVGVKHKKIAVHENLLVKESKCFVDLLSTNAVGDDTLNLKDENPTVIKLMGDFLYRGRSVHLQGRRLSCMKREEYCEEDNGGVR